MLETTWFYAPPSAFRGEWVTLPEEEAHHVSNVLRGGDGEEIVVVDGDGGWYRVRLSEGSGENLVGRVVEERHEIGEPAYHLSVGIGLIKRRRRFETFLEKAVELGVSRIVPLSTDYTEKQTVRRDRIERVLTAAMKQTRRSRRPIVEQVTSIDDMLETEDAEIRLLCHGQEQGVKPLAGLLGETANNELTVLVGPEGGFSSRETDLAQQQDWKLTSLGSRRLRTETAGIAVAAVVQAFFDADGASTVSASLSS